MDLQVTLVFCVIVLVSPQHDFSLLGSPQIIIKELLLTTRLLGALGDIFVFIRVNCIKCQHLAIYQQKIDHVFGQFLCVFISQMLILKNGLYE